MAKYRKKPCKDYMRMFVKLCKKHNVWFAVLSDGIVDCVTFCDSEGSGDYEAPTGLKFGSKAAYEWLEQKIREGNAND